MTRINVNVDVKSLTDEHLLAEHREIKRLPNTKIINRDIPKKFCLGKGHVKFFMNKFKYTFERYKQIHEECLNRNFKVEDYSSNWDTIKNSEVWNDYISNDYDKRILIERISERIMNSNKKTFHYYGLNIDKEDAVKLLKNINYEK